MCVWGGGGGGRGAAFVLHGSLCLVKSCFYLKGILAVGAVGLFLCVSSSWCHGFICCLLLWYFLVIYSLHVHCLLDWLQSLKQFSPMCLTYTCSQSYSDGSVLRKQSHQSKTGYKYMI